MRIARSAAIVGLVLLAVACQTLAPSGPPAANVKLPSFFSDNMVLQRDMPVAVWGWAEPGGRVDVTIDGRTAHAVAGPDGRWTAKLKPMKAGGPYELTVAGKESTVFKNVMVGEVWVASGQSNMQLPVKIGDYGTMNGDQEIAAANHPNIRLLTVPNVTSATPQNDVATDGWKICSPETVPPFSAVAYFFGRDLHQDLNVPIGLIHTSWGGTPAEAWTSREALSAIPQYRQALQDLDNPPADIDKLKQDYEAKLAEWEKSVEAQDAGLAANPAWSSAVQRGDDWSTMALPTFWETAGLPAFDGIVWFSKRFELPAGWAGKDATLYLGAINDRERVWVNGEEIALPEPPKVWTDLRAYPVPGRLLRNGENVVTVRVYDMGGQGGITGRPEDLRLEAAGLQAVPLAGPWQYKVGVDLKQAAPKPKVPAPLTASQNTPANLYNAMIAPLIPYGIRGAIWYQGESNAGRAYEYRELFPTMIRDWRARWGEGDFPFLFVQLANFDSDKQTPAEPADDPWAELREAQLMTLSLPNTGMTSAIDIGNSTDIHPRNKQEVGRRLALAAEHIAYGMDTPVSGPLYKAMKIEDGAIRLSFDHVGGGLVAKDGALKGFAVAGEDRKFVWADARIDGDTVVVSSPQVAKPVAVRYGWSDDPVISLFSKNGLPASPFRTDDWPGVTAGKLYR